MRSKTSNAPPGPGRGRPRPGAAGILEILLLAAALVVPSAAQAGTFPITQEQVVVGTSDGPSGALSEDGLRETLREVDVAPDPLAYPGTENLTKGSQVAGSFPAGVQSSDGVYVQYREATIGPATVSGNPGAVLPGCGWSGCANGRLSDDAYASSASGGDVISFGTFGVTIPAAATITRVEVGYEAFDATGNDRLAITISWDAGTSWCLSITTGSLAGADPNAYAFVDLTACGGHTWVPSDFGGNVSTQFTHSVQGPVDTVDLDANVVRVTYQPLVYELAVQYNWTAVAAGPRYDLRVRGRISDENVSVQILTPPSTWTTRLVLSSPTDQALTVALSTGEVASGNVTVRFVDALGPDVTPSDFWVDYVDVVTSVYAYQLDVVQTVTGITGDQPVLEVVGNISVGGENFDVFAWGFSAGAWALKLSAAFTPVNEVHRIALLPDEIANGTVRIEYRDQDPASAIPATLTLDVVRVSTTDPAVSLTGIALVGGAIAGIAAAILFVFFVVLPRWKTSSDSPDAGDAPRNGRSPAPQIAVGDLRPGGAYLVDEVEPAAAMRSLERLTRMGRSGLLITRRNPADVQRQFKLRHTEAVWLGGPPGSGEGLVLAVPLDDIANDLDDFLRTNPVGAVLIDGLEDLIADNEFQAVLRFIERTVAQVAAGQQILLVSMPPGTLQGRELKQVAQQLDVVRIV